MIAPYMPKATAKWLVENTALTFEQIADFCGLHSLEVQGIADGEVAKGIIGIDPITAGQLTKEEMKILASCDKETAVIFRKAQNTWREFRDAEVIFQGDAWRGGTIRPQMQNSSYASLTEQRVHDLQRYSQPQ